MQKIVLVDGNSIINRAFYGIMGSKMLTTPDGKYTNAVYGFFAILFKVLEEIKPEYLMVAFDLKAPTKRHELYEGYKANRKGMPEELAQQMPIVKEILQAMNITIVEKEGYEADDILGTVAKKAERKGLDVTILSGDRDTFQLATDHIKIRIPHTKMGKTQEDIFDRIAVVEKYGVEPRQLIEVKGLMGDTSDNIPGVPGIGEKTALDLIKTYSSIENLYYKISQNEADLTPKLKQKLVENEDLARLSRTLGKINIHVPIEITIDDLARKEWNKTQVFEIFKSLNFNRFIERFGLKGKKKFPKDIHELLRIETLEIQEEEKIKKLLEEIKSTSKLFYVLETQDITEKEQIQIIPKQITAIYIYHNNLVYEIRIGKQQEKFAKLFQTILEDQKLYKYGYHLSEDYVLFKQLGITLEGIYFDAKIAAYDLNPTNNHYTLEELAIQYLELDILQYLETIGIKQEAQSQMTLFQTEEQGKDFEKYENALYVYVIEQLQEVMTEKLEEIQSQELFQEIEMPLVKILADMQYTGIYVDKEELTAFGDKLKEQLETLKQEIYNLAGEEFNINSPQQLGVVLFEKLKLPVLKKTKRGYSTDVDILERLRQEHPIIEKILEYRSLTKLNSTYVDGVLQYINEKTHRIHSYFHQTITATGRISSTEPNLQNIPTRVELGKQIRKAFKATQGKIFIDADYSQIELRILAHISQDKTMQDAFLNGEDIHSQVASKVFHVKMQDVTKEQRSAAKAVNFGIVYGISGFGLAEQLSISRKRAEEYIDEYLKKYKGVAKFMEEVVDKAKENGFVETLFHRRRTIPELSSSNYMVRQFGARAAMNTPIQGTAADIMKIAMIKVFDRLKKEKLNAKIILQIHDELLLECDIEEKEKVKAILKESMEQAVKLDVPLEVEVSDADNWYDVK